MTSLYERLRAAGVEEFTARSIVDDYDRQSDDGVWIGMLLMAFAMAVSMVLVALSVWHWLA